VLQQILSPEFLLLQAMPALTVALGVIAMEMSILSKRSELRQAAADRRSRP
jgi:hypothetical protein